MCGILIPVLAIFSPLLRHTEAAQSIAILDPNPAYPDKCVYESKLEEGNVIIIGDGESFSPTVGPNACSRIGCRKDGEKFAMSFSSCPVGDIEAPGCRLEMDLTKPYPDCCFKVICDDEDEEYEDQQPSDFESEENVEEIEPVKTLTTTTTDGNKKHPGHHHNYHNKYHYYQRYHKWLATIQNYWNRVRANSVATKYARKKFGHWRGKKNRFYNNRFPNHYGKYFYYHG